jgi:hypothetical protein
MHERSRKLERGRREASDVAGDGNLPLLFSRLR